MAFGQINAKAMFLKYLQGSPKMFFVFRDGMRRYKYVVYVAINKVRAAKDVVHKALKCLSPVF